MSAEGISCRTVTVEIKNLTKDFYLLNPKVHLEHGFSYNPPQPSVHPLTTQVCTFTKTFHTATGSVGVLTYDIFGETKKDPIETLAIMFSVPWDYNLYQNWFAVGIYEKGCKCNNDLFKQMYYDREDRFIRALATGSAINYVGTYLNIKATMCPMGNSIMKVEVSKRNDD